MVDLNIHDVTRIEIQNTKTLETASGTVFNARTLEIRDDNNHIITITLYADNPASLNVAL